MAILFVCDCMICEILIDYMLADCSKIKTMLESISNTVGELKETSTTTSVCQLAIFIQHYVLSK